MFDAFQESLKNGGFVGAEVALKFAAEFTEDLAKVLSLFDADGQLKGGVPLPASCYNDLYKWTMLPVERAVEEARGEDVRCTFSVNIRDADYRKQLYNSATGKAPATLFDDLKERLSGLASRPFDRDTFEQCVADYSLPGWGVETMDKVCGPKGDPRMLIQEFRADGTGPMAPAKPGNVLVQVFVANDEKLKEDRVYVEATGPWHKVTWLETSMMQAVYEALFRDRKRKQYGVAAQATGGFDDSSWYPKWLAEAFCRCTRSVESAISSGMKGMVMTGRRTGGLSLMMLQGMYCQHAFPLMLGISSVTAAYMCRNAGVDPKLVPAVGGTHAHELSMVLSSVLGGVDDQAGMPVSQLIGHMLYFYKSRPGGDVRDSGRKALMPMLPDTLGSRAFMKVASRLTVPFGPHKGEPILSVIGAARQDSGGLEAFRNLMDEFGYKGIIMASEIEVPDDLATAAACGYRVFGAGGFMGDSEKAWDASQNNISMAVKVLRVHVNGERCAATPAKTGETSDTGQIKEGKFEADGTLSPQALQAVKERAQILATAEPRLDATVLQALFESTLRDFCNPDS